MTSSDKSSPHRRQKLMFVNRFYAPDMSATSQILTDVADHLATEEHSVTVITSRMTYDGQSLHTKRQILNQVVVERIWSTRFGRSSSIGRAIDYATFHLSAFIHLLINAPSGAILIAKTDPPMLSVTLGMVSRLRRAKLVNWLQDIFPEVAQYIGEVPRSNPIFAFLRWLRTRSLKRANLNIAIGQKMSETLASFGVDENKVMVIENFVDDEVIRPRQDHSPNLRDEWGIAANDFVIGYSGNLGAAHDIDTMLEVARSLQDQKYFKFLFIGGGKLHQQLIDAMQKRNLSNIVLRPYQPRERLPESLALPNLHWASLKPSLEGLIVPSKSYGIAAAGRPLLMVGDCDGEISSMLREFFFGRCISVSDHQAAADFILELSEDHAKTSELGENARRFIDQHASKKRATQLWSSAIERVSTCDV